VGDGRDTLFWQDNCVENKNLLELLEIEEHDRIDRNLTVSEFIKDKSWNIHKPSQYIRNQEIV